MRVIVVAQQLRGRVPGGIGTYVIGLGQGLKALAAKDGTPDIIYWASRKPRLGRDKVAELGRSSLSVLPARGLERAWDLGIGGPAGPRVAADALHATSLAVPARGDIPLSVMVHDLAWRHHPEAYPAHGHRWHSKALQRALQRADMLITPSAMTAHDLFEAGAATDQVHVVEEGSDHLPPPDNAGARQLLNRLGVSGDYLLTVSTLEPRKNLARLAQAYAVARPRLPEPWPLVVVGPAGWGGSATTLTDTAGVPGILLAGGIPAATLSALYEGARLLAYVPLREGFGLPVLEAMRAGTPVVASPVPSTGGAARAVDPSDIDSIAKGLTEVGTDEDVRQQLVTAGRRRSDELTWERTARQHVELWETMTAAGRR